MLNVAGHREGPPSATRLSWRTHVVVALISAVLVLSAAAWSVSGQLRAIARDIELVTELTQRHLESWLDERWASAGLSGTSFPQATMYERWTEEGDEEFRERLFLRLTQFAQAGGFANVALLGPDFESLWSAFPLTVDLSGPARARWPDGAPVDSQAYLEVSAPGDGATAVAIAVALPTEWLARAPLAVYLLEDEDLASQGLREWAAAVPSGRSLIFRPTDVGLTGQARDALRNGAGGARWSLESGAAQTLSLQLVEGALAPLQSVLGRDDRGIWVVAAGAEIAPIGWYLRVQRDLSGVAAEVAPTLALALVLLVLLYIAAVAVLRRLRDRRLHEAERVARDALSERAEALGLLHAVADASLDAIFAKDLQGRYLLCNPATGTFLGVPPEEVIGRDDRSLLPEPQAAAIMELDRTVMRSGAAVTVEETITFTSGERTFQATKGPLLDEAGQVFGMFGIARDVTDTAREARERSEQARQMEQHVAELERFNRVLVDRELTMIDLKRQLNAALRELGREPAFDLNHLEGDEGRDD